MKLCRSRRAVVAAAATATIVGGAVACGGESQPTASQSAASQSADAQKKISVRAGESIQSAVDRAEPGQVIDIAAGTYHESVQISTPRLTLRGAGAGTVISPSAKGDENACAKAGKGICVSGTAHKKPSDVTLESLTVAGFKKAGIHATGADGLQVLRVTARDNKVQGILVEKSVRTVFRDNTARNNADSGIFLANSMDTEGGALDTKGAVIEGNKLSENRIGVGLRRVRGVKVENNQITGNCGGVFVVGDEGVPRGGALTVTHNTVTGNNKYCAASARLPFIQGTGILLTGVEKTVVTNNDVRDNSGKSPMSGGIVLFGSVVGTSNSDNSIRDNVARGNKPADLANRDLKGKGNTFVNNTMETTEPKQLPNSSPSVAPSTAPSVAPSS
ncbi:nitrous oxide reductase family maturation protein NosD [Actinacidiphila glaucinigra]|uniref:right-handed parallel beta-helix repeat-containing protein n=1 Tax=Actinacidiphila glaucinigra TaxID=235986 RepID=UPI0036EF51B9